MDSLGNELNLREGSATGSQFMYGNYLFDPIDGRAKELTIMPYLLIPKPGDGVETDMKLSQYERIDIQFESFTVKLP